MSNPTEGSNMQKLDDKDLAQIAERKKESEEARMRTEEILAKHRKPAMVKITELMRREAKAKDDADRKRLPDY